MNIKQDLITTGSKFLRKFDSQWMEFLQWLNNFEFTADFLYITDDQKVEFLLNMVETFVFIKIQDHVAPYDPFTFSYDMLIRVLEQMFSHIHGESAFKFRFDRRKQIHGESVKHYALVLQKLLSQCSSKINTKENLLRRFIKGLRNKHAYVEILKQGENVTFDAAMNIAETYENKEWLVLIQNMNINNK